MKKPIAITAGEPSGIGYDILVTAAQTKRRASPWLVFADPNVLLKRAALLNLPLGIELFSDFDHLTQNAGTLTVWPTPCQVPVIPGQLNTHNVAAVIEGLSTAATLCLNRQTAALLTLPVHKGIINQSGLAFSGHTEFFAELSKTPKVVMMLASQKVRVALLTTHIPLSQVPNAITSQNICDTLTVLVDHFKQFHALYRPTILVAGLNPHAGENGYLGKEEQEIIIPTLDILKTDLSANIIGPLAADTLFQAKYLAQADVFLCMYHDQGLAPLKTISFGDTTNITCGLPFIRTSVDHGVALDIAGSGASSTKSFYSTLKVTEQMIKK